MSTSCLLNLFKNGRNGKDGPRAPRHVEVDGEEEPGFARTDTEDGKVIQNVLLLEEEVMRFNLALSRIVE